MASDKTLRVDNKVHPLKLGESFNPRSKVAFHSIRYDFKPASVDTSRESLVEVGEGHQVSITVPHVEGCGTPQTVYNGNKRECPKECVLIIDHTNGSFTLERLTNNIQLKKTRIEGSSKASLAGRPLTPVDVHNNKQKMSPMKPKVAAPVQISPPTNTESPSITPTQTEEVKDMLIGEISDSSDSWDNSDSDSSSDESNKDTDTKAPGSAQPPNPMSSSGGLKSYGSLLRNDLQLSDTSSSDSD
ncbi:ELL-associated factor 1-like isoform X2 [Mizuhopecten yessoensis]|uniref:ELL-associated factor 1-like isoform X2 n=1 Tax=Mizuhopecten yessoensis TaxID=6573 RepID=UPI000B458A8F|nr:ELL-associated factor 1-like isoform X2 [Mizuhopecten yessoensis]